MSNLFEQTLTMIICGRDKFSDDHMGGPNVPKPIEVPGYTVIYRATRMYAGWELDNYIWIVDGPEGRFGITTNHGRAYVIDDTELAQAIQEHEQAWFSLIRAKALLDEKIPHSS